MPTVGQPLLVLLCSISCEYGSNIGREEGLVIMVEMMSLVHIVFSREVDHSAWYKMSFEMQ